MTSFFDFLKETKSISKSGWFAVETIDSVFIASGIRESFSSLKEELQFRTGIAADDQRLLFGGREVECGHFLNEYELRNESTVDLSLYLRGGMPKKGKKGGGKNKGGNKHKFLIDLLFKNKRAE